MNKMVRDLEKFVRHKNMARALQKNGTCSWETAVRLDDEVITTYTWATALPGKQLPHGFSVSLTIAILVKHLLQR